MHAISLCALAIVAIIAPLSAQNCCFPLQWEGQQSMYDVTAVNHIKTNKYTRSRVYSDLKNKRLASYAVINKDGFKENHFRTVMDYNIMKLYFIYRFNHKTVCRVRHIKKPLSANPNCLPASFKLTGGDYVGVGAESLAQKSYVQLTKNRQNIVTVTNSGVPVHNSVLYFPDELRNYIDISWYNVSVGPIKNQDVFNLPPACSKDQSFNILQHIQAMGLAGRMGIEQETARLFDNIEIDQSTHHSAHNIYRHLQSSMHKIVDQTLAQANMAKMSALDRDNLFLKL